MRLDVNRLHHLRQIHKDRLAAFRAASDDRLDQRDKLKHLERARAQIRVNYRETEAQDALADLDRRIDAARSELNAMQDRENETAAASSTSARTFQAALEFAQAQGLPLPDDLRPRNYGAPAAPAREDT